MGLTLSFRFADDMLNQRLIRLLKEKSIKHVVDKNGVVRYGRDDEELVENDLVGSIRDQVFSSWQVLSCPSDWTELYTCYMRERHIPFKEEFINGDICFLIPHRYRPHSWRMGKQRTLKREQVPTR